MSSRRMAFVIAPPRWVGTTWVNEYPESMTQQQLVSSLSHSHLLVDALSKLLLLLPLPVFLLPRDKYFIAAIHGPNTRATLPTPNSRNKIQSTPSDMTEGTCGGSRRRKVQLLDEYFCIEALLLVLASSVDAALPRRFAAEGPWSFKNPPSFIWGVGTTPNTSNVRAQTLSWVSPSHIIPLSIELFQVSCPKFFMRFVISSPVRTVNWWGGRAVALYIVDIWLPRPLLCGGTRPYFTVHPPLSTTMHAGKGLSFVVSRPLLDVTVADFPVPVAGGFLFVGVATAVSDPMVRDEKWSK